MNIAILHYHLNRGGVTRVILNQLSALQRVMKGQSPARVAIFYGGRAEGWPVDLSEQLKTIELSLVPIEGLDYDSKPAAKPELLARVLREELEQRGFYPHDTLMHAHNHGLGKNCSLPGALRILADSGFPLLLQIHDFAEDFRPDLYRQLSEALRPDELTASLYPQADHVHYAVLNRRDLGVLKQAGVEQQRLHFLPNPVLEQKTPAVRDHSRLKLQKLFDVPLESRFALYPVRGIRRKNLGEVLLWSLLSAGDTYVGVTLAPLNPLAIPYYTHWKELAAELDLHCRFETGGAGGLTFEENLAAADVVLTTSVAEGFGMVFLESWLAGRRLAGRNLPEITADFLEAGLDFEALYHRLDIPLEWVGRRTLRDAWSEAASVIMKAYGKTSLGKDELDRVLDAKRHNGLIDFADLHEPLQETVIRKVAGDTGARRELLELNPKITAADSENAELVEKNRRLVTQTYSQEPSGRRLLQIYKTVLASSKTSKTTPPPHGPAILDHFLDLKRFQLIRG